MSPRAPDLSLSITANRGGSGSSDQDDYRTFPRSRKSNFQIRRNADCRTGECCFQGRPHSLLHLRLSSARQSRAYCSDRVSCDPRFLQAKIRRFLDFTCGRFHSHSGRVRWPREAAGKNLFRRVHQDAFRLCAAAIDAQNVIHGKSIREKWRTRIDSR